MTGTLPFDRPLPPASHRRDPATSHEAEIAHTKSGARGLNIEHVIELVVLNPGCTARELERKSHLDLLEVRRRLTDAKDRGRVYQGAARVSAGGGKHKESTWFPS